MSPDVIGARSAALRVVSARIRELVHELEHLLPHVREADSRIVLEQPDALSVMAGGAILHTFYSELEKSFQLVAERVDGSEPTGADWHSELCEQIFLEVPGVRPAVLPEVLRDQTRHLRRFRHVFRVVYSIQLDPKPIKELLSALPGYWGQARPFLEKFAQVLQQIASGLEDS